MSREDLIGAVNILSDQVVNRADILSGGYTPKRKVSALRITVALGRTAKFGFSVQASGSSNTNLGNEALIYLNNQNDLTVNRAYTFTIGVRSDYKYNFHTDDNTSQPGLIHYLAIEEIGSAEL